MSWSADQEQAEWFRDRWLAAGVPARLYVATTPPTAVLAYIGERGESEVVANPWVIRRRIEEVTQ